MDRRIKVLKSSPYSKHQMYNIRKNTDTPNLGEKSKFGVFFLGGGQVGPFLHTWVCKTWSFCLRLQNL